MNRKFLFKATGCLTFLFINILNICGQVFPTDNAIWNIVKLEGNEHYKYGMTGDTIINNLKYSKLYLLNDTLLEIDVNDEYIGGIRQDGRKVVMKPANNIWGEELNEFTLYNFDKEAFDTIRVNRYLDNFYYLAPSFEYVKKNSGFESITYQVIQSLVFENKHTLHVYDPVSYLSDYWIEGVGSIRGLFFRPKVYSTGSVIGTQLLCLKVDDKIVFKETECGCLEDNDRLATENKNIFKQKDFVFYNRLSGSIEVEVDQPPYKFSLYNMNGDIVKSFEGKNSHETFRINNINPGLYIYKLNAKNRNSSGKIVVMK